MITFSVHFGPYQTIFHSGKSQSPKPVLHFVYGGGPSYPLSAISNYSPLWAISDFYLLWEVSEPYPFPPLYLEATLAIHSGHYETTFHSGKPQSLT